MQRLIKLKKVPYAIYELDEFLIEEIKRDVGSKYLFYYPNDDSTIIYTIEED